MTAVLGAALSIPSLPAAVAAPARTSQQDELVDFDAKFREGQLQSKRGEFLAAARTWTAASLLLVENPTNRDNLIAIHEYIAEAYTKAIANGASDATIREALGVFDAYAGRFTTAYPNEALPEKIATMRESLRARIEPEPKPPVAPTRPPPTPVTVEGEKQDQAVAKKPWRGMAMAGGIVSAGGVAMGVMFIGGYVRTKSFERQFVEPDNMCSRSDPNEICQSILDRGHRSDVAAVVGLISMPVLLATGATLLGVALRRRATQHAFAPVFGAGMLGAVWQRRF